MSVLIKGMKMPPRCELCIFEDYGYCKIAERYFGGNAKHEIASFCPLVEVKEPHGDLIDRNQLALPSEDIGSKFAVEYAQAVIKAEGGE